jgi:hypothetical protein
MAGKKAMEKLVRELYAARKRGDYDAMAVMCAPKASLRLAGAAEHCPVAGTTRGRAALRERFAAGRSTRCGKGTAFTGFAGMGGRKAATPAFSRPCRHGARAWNESRKNGQD